MKRLLSLIHRHRRLLAGSAPIVLLVAVVPFAVRAGGSEPAQTVGAVAQASQASPGSPGSPIWPPALAVSRTSARAATARRPAGHAGAPLRPASATTPSNPPGAAVALRQATGLSLSQVSARPVCPRPAAGHASCAAETVVLRSSGAPVHPRVSAYRALGRVWPTRHRHLARSAAAGPESPSQAPPQADTPAFLQQAYDLSYLSQNSGSSDTVAVVDAYDDPTAEADLATYRSTYSLPPCTSANGCFQKVNQTGAASPLPPAASDWDQEISLDLDAVSAICPNCHITLVEANSSAYSDLQAAMRWAASQPGVKQISASWSGTSTSVPSGFQTFPGVATVAATGDYGYPGAGEDNYPAAIPGVTAAGGTSLSPASTASPRGFGETAWSWNGADGGGSGCDLHFNRPAYQPAGACTGRAYADVSADADPVTGLAVYDQGNWTLVGGTSLATPLIAAYYAITGVSDATPQWAYGAKAELNDVVQGSTGSCAGAISYICNAGVGYDGPTGVGSISGSVVSGAPGLGGAAVSSGAGAGASGSYVQSVSDHDATIAGGVYRNGLDTQWWIEYGTTTAYGSQTPASDIGAGSAPVAVTGYLSQLAPATTYHYRLVAQNGLGTTYGYDYTFTTSPAPAAAPIAAFALPAGTPAPGTPVTFDGSASAAPSGAAISDYSWNFGDGTTADTATTATATHTYAARGTYVVTLTVTSNGQTDTTTQSVTVDDPPTAAFTPSLSAVAPGTSVTFDGGASAAGTGGSITDYSWNFGDGSTSDTGTSSGAAHTFNTPGTYTVTLTTTDDLNVTATVTKTVTVADFTVSPANPSPGTQVTFTALNTNPDITDYIWNFGDGSQPVDTGTNPTATYTYATRNAYPVTLTIETASGSDERALASPASAATIMVDGPLTPAFTSSATAPVTPGTAVNFDAGTSTASSGGSISDYSWNFGDGTSTDARSNTTASHTFNSPGLYTVTLTTTDDLGESATASQQVLVDQPTASFTPPATSVAANAQATFDASNSSDPESPIVDYRWDFGDGSTVDAGNATAASHAYANPGTYTVKLTVTDQFGFSATTSQQIAVVQPAAPQPSGSTATPPSSSGSSTPTAPPASPAPAPTPTPKSSGPAPVAPKALSAGLGAAKKQKLAPALAHGLHLTLAVSQGTTASFQVTLPASEGRLAGGRQPKAGPIVLLRTRAQRLGAGRHALTLRLSRAAARELGVTGRDPIVVTVKVTLTSFTGATVTRSLKIALTR